MKFKKTIWFGIWGALWASGGFSLLRKGLYLLSNLDSADTTKSYLKQGFKFLFSEHLAVNMMILFAVFIGFIKGKTVIAKTAKRISDKISIIDGPVSIKQAFDFKTLLIMGVMISLGTILNMAKTPNDIRGFIDTTVGSALLHGSMTFFKGIFVRKVKEALGHK